MQIVIAFRGTDAPRDWRTNLTYKKQPFNSTAEIDAFNESLQEAGSEKRAGKRAAAVEQRRLIEGYVHTGFLEACNNVMPYVNEEVHNYMSNNDTVSDWQIHMTGHSLGGALAVLAAAKFKQKCALLRHVDM